MRDMIKKIKTFFNKIHVKFMSNSSYIRYLRAKGVHIGTGCNIHKGVVFGTEPWLIKIGNNVRITKGVQFITYDGGLWTLRKMGLIDKEAVKYGTIMIGDNCNISWNVIIMPDVMIGNNCIIAAGAVVTKNIPDGTIWGGIPAKQIETVEEYHKKVSKIAVPTYSMTEADKKEYLKINCPELFEKLDH